MEKKKSWTYPVCATLSDSKGKEVLNVITQRYMIGIYVAIYKNGRIATQLNMRPSNMKKFMKQFDADNLSDKAKQEGLTVSFGREIIITEDKDGFFQEVKEQVETI